MSKQLEQQISAGSATDSVSSGAARLDRSAALALAEQTETAVLMAEARGLRDAGFNSTITYSRKVFVPLTHLCRDVCHYCTFAKTPSRIDKAYMSLEEVLDTVRQGQQLGCNEVLLTLGEKPELRYRAAREALEQLGYSSTLEYLTHIAEQVLEQTGLLPHINAGCMTRDEMAALRRVSPSMGLMLESSAERLCEKGMPHYGSPDKAPARRLETLRIAGELAVPFTTGILIGIGETRRERVESLLAIRDLHDQYGHIQEIIIQNFRAKPETKMAEAPEPDLNELLWTIAVARLIFGAEMSLQAPPNLSPGVLPQIVNAGINDWGGVSPLTPDFVNPEAPWPHLQRLERETAMAGKTLQQRLTIYPQYALQAERWLDQGLHKAVLNRIDSEGLAHDASWFAGEPGADPEHPVAATVFTQSAAIDADLSAAVAKASRAEPLDERQIVALFAARGRELDYVFEAADALRRETVGDEVAYVVNRNINYTNICYYKCEFCAFSKGKTHEELRGRPYDLPLEEISRRVTEAWQRGATEVCMQGGIHPSYTGQTYLDILDCVRAAAPDMHIHAFSPLEVWQGASTLGISVEEFLQALQQAGLKSLPGTAAEILDDEVRAVICPDKINTEQWLEVMRTAHRVGLRSTSTIMYGHIESPLHWARHLLRLRELQAETGGFTEFVPLPFVHRESPMYRRRGSRRGPTLREALLMHAVARLTLHGQIHNIQASWVKLGNTAVAYALNAGANDLGGTLMNESISRAAGASHGQEMTPQQMESLISSLERQPRQRSTLYGSVSEERMRTARNAAPLASLTDTGRVATEAGACSAGSSGTVKPVQDVASVIIARAAD